VTTITVTINDEGKPVGLTPKDQRAWARFCKTMKGAEPGEVFSLDYWFPRSGSFHRLHMKMMAVLFESQEQFDDPDKFRKWMETGAGYCDIVPGPNGRMVAIPKSISYKSLDDEGMREVHEAIKAFARSERFSDFLWPHLSADQQAEMVESIIRPFERG